MPFGLDFMTKIKRHSPKSNKFTTLPQKDMKYLIIEQAG
jgi:hypothetical protein